MTCLTCQHGALRDGADADRDKYLRRMAALGFVNCTRSPLRATFHGTEHRCKHWAAADELTASARLAWNQARTAAKPATPPQPAPSKR